MKGWISREVVLKSRKRNNKHIKGYASVFEVLDRHGDMLVKGAFRDAEAKDARLLLHHDPTQPIGIITKLKEDYYGLLIEADVNTDVEAGKEAMALIKQGALGGLSIGFTIKSSSYDEEGRRVIDHVDLAEISVVTFPANRDAGIRCYKHKILSDEDFAQRKKKNAMKKLLNSIQQLSER